MTNRAKSGHKPAGTYRKEFKAMAKYEKQLSKTIWAYRYIPLNTNDNEDFWYLVDTNKQIALETPFSTLEEATEYFRKELKNNV